jgi:hypothetical protein
MNKIIARVEKSPHQHQCTSCNVFFFAMSSNVTLEFSSEIENKVVMQHCQIVET